MTRQALTEVATGISMLVVDAWEVRATGTQGESFEVEFRKDTVEASMQLISVTSEDLGLAAAIDKFRFDLMNSLVSLGCQIEPSDKNLRNVISSRHPDRPGHILHYLGNSNPLVHFSAAAVMNETQIREIVLMADSVVIEPDFVKKFKDYPFGEIIPLELNAELWSVE